MQQLPRMTQPIKGLLSFIAGLILFLYVTNIITMGLQMILLLGAILLMIYGFVEMDAYRKLMKFVNKK